MPRANARHYARKHGPDAVADPAIRDMLWKRAVDGKLSCAVAFDVAKQLGVSPEAVGRTADLVELRLVKCQLGLFGYGSRKTIIKPATSVPPALAKAIREGLVNGRLPCHSAWEIAKALEIHKTKVSAACNALGVKIGPCQLGAF